MLEIIVGQKYIAKVYEQRSIRILQHILKNI